MEGTMIRLWRQTTKEGKVFLTGAMSKVTRLVIVENDRKRHPDDPDSFAYVVPNRGAGHVPEQVQGL